MLDLLIRNGEVVTPQGVGRWTVGIKSEQIAYVGLDDPSLQGGRTIDAAGKIVVPGGIERVLTAERALDGTFLPNSQGDR